MKTARLLRTLVPLFATALLVVPSGVLAHGGGGGGGRSKVRQSLTRPQPAVNDAVNGRMDIRTRDDRQEFKVRVRRADRLVDHELWIENGSGVMEFVAAFKTDARSLRYRARLRDGEGELPLGVSLLDELVGRHLEIRGGADVVLAADIPDLTPLRDAKAKEDLDPTLDTPAGAEAEIRVRSRPRKGDERFRVKVHDFPLAPGQELRLFLEDPMDPGVLVDQGALRPDGSDEAEFRARTRKGQPLPFGVGSTRDLGDLDLEIRDADTGTVYFDGMVPVLD